MSQITPRFRGALIMPSGRKLSTRVVDISPGLVRMHFHALSAPTLQAGDQLTLEVQRRDLPSLPAMSGRLVRSIDVMLGRVLEFEIQNQAELSRMLDPSLRPVLGRSREERRAWHDEAVAVEVETKMLQVFSHSRLRDLSPGGVSLWASPDLLRQAAPGSELRVSLPLGKHADEPIRLWCRVVHERSEAEGVHLGLSFLEPKNRYYREQIERVQQLLVPREGPVLAA